LHGDSESLEPLWQSFVAHSRPVGAGAWQLLDVLAGLPSITVATQDHFVAQMLNLDALGGISFSKGCYTGQEVIARLHYLGQLKRRMFLLYAEEAEDAAPGMSIHLSDGDTQAVGEVVVAQPHPQQGTALLVVLQIAHAGSGQLRLGAIDGAALSKPVTLVSE
jgi:folate-binding protein YgfZ